MPFKTKSVQGYHQSEFKNFFEFLRMEEVQRPQEH